MFCVLWHCFWKLLFFWSFDVDVIIVAVVFVLFVWYVCVCFLCLGGVGLVSFCFVPLHVFFVCVFEFRCIADTVSVLCVMCFVCLFACVRVLFVMFLCWVCVFACCV